MGEATRRASDVRSGAIRAWPTLLREVQSLGVCHIQRKGQLQQPSKRWLIMAMLRSTLTFAFRMYRREGDSAALARTAFPDLSVQTLLLNPEAKGRARSLCMPAGNENRFLNTLWLLDRWRGHVDEETNQSFEPMPQRP